MRALAKCDPFREDYFIVMDRLYDTLEKRLETWASRLNRSTGFAAKLTDRKGMKKRELYEERMVAVFDLSAALEYLVSLSAFGVIPFHCASPCPALSPMIA